MLVRAAARSSGPGIGRGLAIGDLDKRWMADLVRVTRQLAVACCGISRASRRRHRGGNQLVGTNAATSGSTVTLDTGTRNSRATRREEEVTFPRTTRGFFWARRSGRPEPARDGEVVVGQYGTLDSLEAELLGASRRRLKGPEDRISSDCVSPSITSRRGQIVVVGWRMMRATPVACAGPRTRLSNSRPRPESLQLREHTCAVCGPAE